MDVDTKIDDFVAKHNLYFATALSEVRQGCKQTHWMWYIFPQIVGLGRSATSVRYAIYSIAEAKAFLAHPQLGANLREICRALLALNGYTAQQVFGPIDAAKLCSSMTLFDAIAPNDLFGQMLERYFANKRDTKTLCRLSLNDRVVSALQFIGVDAADFNITRQMYSVWRPHPMHRFSHIYRVMIGSALIAHKIGESRLGLLAFLAAFIHDLGRVNDGTDPQHGRRSATIWLPRLTHLMAKYKISSEERDIIGKAATYHSERVGGTILSNECRKVLKIVKDADALDRCRFGPRGLNRDMLRFAESHRCILPIEQIYKESDRLQMINYEIPFKDFLEVVKF